MFEKYKGYQLSFYPVAFDSRQRLVPYKPAIINILQENKQIATFVFTFDIGSLVAWAQPVDLLKLALDAAKEQIDKGLDYDHYEFDFISGEFTEVILLRD